MKAWIIKPGIEPHQEIEIRNAWQALDEVRTHFDDATLDLTRVKFRDKLCTMTVDDAGHAKGLAHNPEATRAYLANCRPGTTHYIVGTAIIFDGLLP